MNRLVAVWAWAWRFSIFRQLVFELVRGAW